ncbi:MAG: abortive infection family protein [Planctomycetes bacterium]|nr:abortive infection family protein [Planctomycetota bacterium]
MVYEPISKKTRNEFREFLVGWTLREIEAEFEGAHIACDRGYEPGLGGQRRTLVEQHYHTLDLSRAADIRRLLAAYESILDRATRKLPDQFDRQAAERAIEGLVACLRKDGLRYQDGKITPITPEARRAFEEGGADRSVSEVTRRSIADAIQVGGISWSGRLSETDFLGRLYDLQSMPSYDSRYQTASGDIWKHREMNPNDWADDWVFTDRRFDLLHASDEAFLRFLCEMVHPVVRPESRDVEVLVAVFNEHLAADDWQIVPATHISGKPVFAARRRVLGGSASLEAVKSLAQVLDAGYMIDQITRMELAVQSDPELAIGTAKELVETVCKTILSDCGGAVSASADLPQLVKQVRDKLDLLPDDVPEKAKGAETIRRLLSNLGMVAQGLAEMRGLYGSGHGKHARVKGLQSRHARLAVGAAQTLAVFLFETYQEREKG